jgi:hypothetical protein
MRIHATKGDPQQRVSEAPTNSGDLFSITHSIPHVSPQFSCLNQQLIAACMVGMSSL